MLRSYKFRLYTTTAQETALTGMLGALCDLYNACLQQRIEAYQRRDIGLRYGNQAAELKAVREADERQGGFSFGAEQQVLRRLDKTYSAFFGRMKRGAKAGFPRFRAKSRYDSADFRVGDGLTIRKSGPYLARSRSAGIATCGTARTSCRKIVDQFRTSQWRI
jgi:putative transposase